MTRTINDILEYEGRCSYMKFVLGMIQYISDPDYQRRLWIKGIPGSLGSWEDIMDEFDIDNFLKDMTSESNPEFGLSAHQIEELWKLRNIVDEYCKATPKYMNPRDVLSDPRWHKVVECAKETLKAFEGYKVPTDDMLKF